MAKKKESSSKEKAQERSVSDLKGKDKKIYEALMQARAAIMEQYKFHKDEALDFQKNSAAEVSGMSSHMADQDTSIHDMELGMLTNDGEILELIDEAIERLLAGEYGECIDCGCDINQERLEIMPYARLCIKCKSERERNGDDMIG